MSRQPEKTLKIALVQMCSSSDMANNLAQAEQWIAQASKSGAEMVVLPESFSLMEKYDGQKVELLNPEAFALVINEINLHSNQQRNDELGIFNQREWLSCMAVTYKICIVGGTVAVQSEQPNRPFARTYVFDKHGEELAFYDKIHLFDVNVAQGESYSESANTMPGEKLATFSLNGFRCGLSVCYDLRFPEMYRNYSQQGVDVLLAPSAFTRKTGKVHWELLLKARAVENLCYVLAPNQTGEHDNKRKTYGHSMVVDPWGETIVQIVEESGVIFATLQKQMLEDIRQKFPVLKHQKLL